MEAVGVFGNSAAGRDPEICCNPSTLYFKPKSHGLSEAFAFTATSSPVSSKCVSALTLRLA